VFQKIEKKIGWNLNINSKKILDEIKYIDKLKIKYSKLRDKARKDNDVIYHNYLGIILELTNYQDILKKSLNANK